MKIEIEIFNKNELIRAAQLIGIKNKDDKLKNISKPELIKMILNKVNSGNLDFRTMYERTLKLFKIDYDETDTDDMLKIKLYQFNCEKLEKAIKKMSKKKKKRLTEKLEKSLDPTILHDMKRVSKNAAFAGSGILLLQGGAIVITGSNLGICILLTQGLSGLSGLLGITFPFAAYTTAAVAGGKILAVAGFLTQPWVMIPIFGLSVYLIIKKEKNKKYIKLAGINYLIESKKAREI